MFIIETENQSTNSTASTLGTSPVVTSSQANACSAYQFDEMAKLKALFLGLIRQKRWIYFLNDQVKLKANHLPVLQVKLKEHHSQYESLKRIILAGNSSAVVIENNQLNNEQLKAMLALSIEHKVQLIMLENIQDSETLH